MPPLPLAEIAESSGAPLMIGIVVVAISALLNVAVMVKQLVGGNKGERQIEPTQLHSITSELREQTATLNKLDRESGERTETIRAVKESVETLRRETREDSDKIHQRIGGISRELAATTAKVDIAIKQS